MQVSNVTLTAMKMVAIKVVGRRSELSHRVPMAWLDLVSRLDEIPHKVNPDLFYDAGSEAEMLSGGADGVFIRYIGTEVSEFGHLPAGMLPLTIPARTYAVATVQGTADQIDPTYLGLRAWLREQGLQTDPQAYGFERYDTRRQNVTPPYDRFDYDIFTPLLVKE